MTTGTLHTTWLSLIDRAGPFLSVQVLESALPQGLEAVQTKFKQKLRLAYEEWRDAVDNEDPQLAELHKEWVKLVLCDILEYDNNSLIPNSTGEVKYTNEELATEYAPTFIVKSPASDKIRFFIDVLSPDSDLEKPCDGEKWPASIVEKMTLLCRFQKIRYGLVTNGEKWIVVSAPIGATSGTATWYSRLWRYEPVTLKAFQTLLGVRRCFGSAEATLDVLLDSSLSSYEEVTNTLGEQVRRAVEVLIQSLDSADQDRNRELLDGIPPSELYDASVTVMMRLVFLLCAEERGLLLLGDPTYDQFYAVTTLRAQLAEEAGKLGPEVLERRHDAWSRLLAIFRAVYGGIEHETLRLPPLGGSLFDPDKYPFLEGRKTGSWRDSGAAPLPIDNRTVLLLLTALQVLEQKGGALHLSYRALDVEQIGHVYEGLLELKVERVPEPTLALSGSKGKSNPFANITVLEDKFKSGKDQLTEYLADLTGRTKASLLKQIDVSLNEVEFGSLLLSCGGDLDLANRVKPFFFLLRKDSWGTPMIYQSNSYAVIQGANRRETGTHYTPKIFTELVIAKTLEPLVYKGITEGKPKEEWEIKKSAEILNLKICDPAMGSAAFLVQSCRWLAERVVEAWNKEEQLESDFYKNFKSINLDVLPSSAHERILVARRLVAEKCLHGVDINPLAVELGKLSLWLTTMSKGKPFDYLDHNIKCGDTLIGAHLLDQISRFQTKPEGESREQLGLFEYNFRQFLETAISLRKGIEEIRFLDISDVTKASDLNKEALSVLNSVSLLSDSIFAANFKVGKRNNQLENEFKIIREKAQGVISGEEEPTESLRSYCTKVLKDRVGEGLSVIRPFHWILEFPEVFQQGGFDGIVSNPPFRGGTKISGDHGDDYLSFLKSNYVSKQNTDLSAYFFQRMLQITNERGRVGMIATKAIAQGDTREASLDLISSLGGRIYRASPNIEWPGKAAVRVSLVWVEKQQSNILPILHEKNVNGISPLLAEGNDTFSKPNTLKQNVLSFKGVTVVGNDLFAVSNDERVEYLKANELNGQVVKRFLIGQDITTSVGALPTRWIIDFADMAESEAIKYQKPYEHVYQRVRPFRMTVNRKAHREKWWQYGDVRQGMRRAICYLQRVLVAPQTTKFLCFTWCPINWVFDQKCVVIATDKDVYFSLLSSDVFDIWTRQWCSTNGVGDTLSFAPTDSYETFPFCRDYDVSLSSLGREFYELRQEFMQERSIGLTEFYNEFHNRTCENSVIVRLRDLQVKINSSVLSAYGWDDVDSTLDFHLTKDGIRYGFCEDSKKEILERLLKLNHLESNGSISVETEDGTESEGELEHQEESK